MRKQCALFLIMGIVLAASSGCGTIYGAVVDERNVEEIAADTRAKTAIVAEFVRDEVVKALDVSVGCYRGNVYLVGEYETPEQEARMMEIARAVKGVKNITAYLLPKRKNPACGAKDNLVLTAKIKAKLVGDKQIWSTNIDVKTLQCIAVMWGLVGSKAEIQKAVAHARSVEGVKEVKSFLKSVR